MLVELTRLGSYELCAVRYAGAAPAAAGAVAPAASSVVHVQAQVCFAQPLLLLGCLSKLSFRSECPWTRQPDLACALRTPLLHDLPTVDLSY